MQFDTPPAQVDAEQFRTTVANFFQVRPRRKRASARARKRRMTMLTLARAQLDTSQVLINRVYPMGSGSAVDFFALFPDDDDAENFENAVTDPQQLRAVFAATPALTNPRLVPAGAADGSSSPMMSAQGALCERLTSSHIHGAHSRALMPNFAAPMMSNAVTAGAGGQGTGGAGGAASGEGASPGSPGVGTPGAPGTVTTSGGR